MAEKSTNEESYDNIFYTIKRAQQGDKMAVPTIQKALEEVPEIREMLGGELQEIVDLTVSRCLGAEDDLAFREAIKHKLNELRRELEGPNPSHLEKLLIDRIVACWLQVQEADFQAARPNGLSAAQANFVQKRQDKAHKRFLSAIKTLTQVRKMALPNLQVNIAENQQVNNPSS